MSESAGLVGVTVQAIVAQAQALGLTWNLRLATVAAASSDFGLTVILDSDTVAISATNISGIPMISGARVYVLMIPAGNYVIGSTQTHSGVAAYAALGVSGSTASGSYADMPGSPSVTLAPQLGTALLVTIQTSCFCDTNGGIVDLAFLVAGVDVQATKVGLSAANVRQALGGQSLINRAAGGPMTITARWRQSGAGTLFHDTTDWVSLTVQTVVAI